jgi:signal transduction histidine kinase
MISWISRSWSQGSRDCHPNPSLRRILSKAPRASCEILSRLADRSLARRFLTQQIAHVFSNFISNAVKHTKPGGEVTLAAKRHGGGVRFSVIDHGPGIPVAYQEQLFDRFFRVPGAEVSGAGLGLAIAKEIVVAQGGTIGVHSKPGEGSEFYFDLPGVEIGGES